MVFTNSPTFLSMKISLWFANDVSLLPSGY
jgi:hypothetical protein